MGQMYFPGEDQNGNEEYENAWDAYSSLLDSLLMSKKGRQQGKR